MDRVLWNRKENKKITMVWIRGYNDDQKEINQSKVEEWNHHNNNKFNQNTKLDNVGNGCDFIKEEDIPGYINIIIFMKK